MVKMTNEEFLEELKKLHINPTEYQMNQLEKFYNLLVE